GEEPDLQQAVAREKDPLEQLRAVEAAERQQVEAVDEEQHENRVLLQRIRRTDVPNEQDDPEHDSGKRAEEQDHGFLPRRDAVSPPGNRGAEERDEEHAHVAVAEYAHTGVVAQLVEQQDGHDHGDVQRRSRGLELREDERRERQDEQHTAVRALRRLEQSTALL